MTNFSSSSLSVRKQLPLPLRMGYGWHTFLSFRWNLGFPEQKLPIQLEDLDRAGV